MLTHQCGTDTPTDHDERDPQCRARALHHHIRWHLNDNVEWEEDGESVLSCIVSLCSKHGFDSAEASVGCSLTLYCKPFIPRSFSRPAKRALPMLVLDNRQHFVNSKWCPWSRRGYWVTFMTTRRTDRGSSIDKVKLGME
jgi:hypothetical protein